MRNINHELAKLQPIQYPSMNMGDLALLGSLNAGGANMDDTDLKAYYKFNESSGDIINKSEATASLGSAADIAITGATYSQTGKIGKAKLTRSCTGANARTFITTNYQPIPNAGEARETIYVTKWATTNVQIVAHAREIGEAIKISQWKALQINRPIHACHATQSIDIGQSAVRVYPNICDVSEVYYTIDVGQGAIPIDE